MQIIKRDNNTRNYPTYFPFRSVFDDFFTPSIWEERIPISSPSVDLWEEKENIFVKMALPGIKKEDIKITVEEDRVSISGQTKKAEEQKEKEKKYYYRSMESSFEQSFNLPTKIDANKVEAEFKDGVLEIKLPKIDVVKPKTIEIK